MEDNREPMPINPNTGRPLEVLNPMPFARELVKLGEQMVVTNGLAATTDNLVVACGMVMDSGEHSDNPMHTPILRAIIFAMIEQGYKLTPSLEARAKMGADVVIKESIDQAIAEAVKRREKE